MLFSIWLGLFFIIIIIVWWSCLLFLAKPRHLSHKGLSNLAEEVTFLDRRSEHLVSGYLSTAHFPHPVFPGISSVQKNLWFAHHLAIQNPALLRTSYVLAPMLNDSLEKHFTRQFYVCPEGSSRPTYVLGLQFTLRSAPGPGPPKD